MKFNDYSDQAGQHAFLSPSSYHWINYDDEKLVSVYKKKMATERGTRLHAYAEESIRLGIKLPKTASSLNMFVNDAIGLVMKPEQVLWYSENAFGTADAISFREGILRIHDLKTGESPVSMKQLEIYTALFCLEYNKAPSTFTTELRIYQSGKIVIHSPKPKDIETIMKTIKKFDLVIKEIKTSAEE